MTPNGVPADHLAVGSATLGVMRNLGMTIGAATAGSLFGASSAAGVELPRVHWALGCGAALAALGSAAVSMRPPRPRS